MRLTGSIPNGYLRIQDLQRWSFPLFSETATIKCLVIIYVNFFFLHISTYSMLEEEE